MLESLQSFLALSLFIPDGNCYLEKPAWVWLGIASDSLIALVYCCIPIIFVYLVQKQQNLPFKGIFLLFAASMASCGTTHILEVWTLWHPTYWLSASLKALTASVSLCTAVALIRIIPQILALPTSTQPSVANLILEPEIMERRRIEEKLRSSQQMLQLVMDNIPQFIFWKDRNSVFLGCNRNFAKVAGLKNSEEIIGKTDYDLPWKKQEADFFRECDARVMETNTPEYHIIESQFQADGKQAWLDTNKIPLDDAQGNVVGILGTYEDITERKQAERLLKQAKEELEIRVEARTVQIRQAIQQLESEIEERKQTEEALRQSEERFRSLSACSPVGIYLTDIEGRCTYTNPRYQAIADFSFEESLGTGWLQLVHPDDREWVLADWTACAREGREYSHEYRFQTRQGIVRWVHVRSSPMFCDQGELIGHVGTVEDITERKQSEEALRTTNQTLQTLIKASPIAITTINPDLNVTTWNPAAERLFGWSEAEVVGRPLPIIPEDQQEDFRVQIQHEFEGRVQTGLEVQRQRKDGSLIEVNLWTAPLFNSDGIVTGSIGLLVDLSDRIRAEKALRESQQQLQSILDNSLAVIYVKNPQGRYMLVNRRFETLFQVDREAVKGKTDYDIFPQETAEAFRVNDQTVLQTGTPLEIEEVVPHDDGLHTYISIKFPLYDSVGVPYAVCGTSTDITERKQAEEALRQSERRFRAIFEQSFQLSGVLTPDGILIEANQTALDFIGAKLEDVIGRPFWETPWWTISPLTQERLRNAIAQSAQGQFVRYDVDMLTTDGTVATVDFSLRPVKDETGQVVLLIPECLDITERKRAEEEQQKLIALIESSSDFIGLATLEGQSLFVNEAGQKLVGLEGMAEVKQMTISEYLMPGDRREFTDSILPVVRQRERWEGEFHFRHFQTGKRIPVYFNLFTIKDRPTGQPIALATVTRDITERKRAEEELRQSEARFRDLARREALLNRLASLIRNSLDLDTILETTVLEIYYQLSIDVCVFAWYRQDSTPPGWEVVKDAKNPDLPSFLGLYPLESWRPFTCKLVNQEVCPVNQGNESDCAVQPMYLPYGSAALLSLPIHTQSGDLGALTCGRLVYQEDWTDEELEMLQAVANQLIIGINQAQLYEQSRLAATTAQTKATQLEVALRHLQHTQAQLIQTEKMSSLGQLVAGVAHEINNPVSFIYGNLTHINQYARDLLKLIQLYEESYPRRARAIQTMAQEIDLDFIKEDLPKILSSMEMGTDRIRQIVLSLRNFSRLEQAEMKQVDIHEGLDNTLLILAHRLKPKSGYPGIQVIKEYGNLPLVQCYVGLLNQVFMNILTNAIDALALGTPSSSTPMIRICTEVLDTNQVRIRIADNGPGMTQEVQRRLFDPFFTTKPVGSGTGLGLSISYQIVVERHGGELQCSSAPNQGTEFSIYLPMYL